MLENNNCISIDFDCVPEWFKPYVLRIARTHYELTADELIMTYNLLFSNDLSHVGQLIDSLEKNLIWP